jgi:hypothetical protein
LKGSANTSADDAVACMPVHASLRPLE